jgi:hypothetical protein
VNLQILQNVLLRHCLLLQLQITAQISEESTRIASKELAKALKIQTVNLLPDADVNLAKLEVCFVDQILHVLFWCAVC